MPNTAGTISQQKTNGSRDKNTSNFLDENNQIKTKTKFASRAKGIVRLNKAMYLILAGWITEDA